ncbi:MAG: DUF4982 domain-containing protein [Paludibacter sp.]|nr:DUF4982 domain-containing protein [Paludibacter sp.]
MTQHLSKNIIILLLLILFIPNFLDSQNQRSKYNFNSDWEIVFGDVNIKQASESKTSKKVTLPNAFNEDESFRIPIDELSDTIVWYRKNFKLPKSSLGKKVFLEFEGVRFGAEFWVNGKNIGMHENGVMAFGFDITNVVNYKSDNLIAVRIDNSWRYKEKSSGSTYQWNDKNFNANYGGIPKNVFLHITPKLYQTFPLYSNLKTTGTYIYAREINVSKKRAMIYAESEVRNEFETDKNFSYEVILEDIDGKIIKKISGSEFSIKAGETTRVKAGALVENLNFWSWGYGYLYNVSTVLKVNGVPLDVVKTRTGFRKTAFRDGMVFLNDRVIQMKGYAQRTSNEWPAVGMSVPAWLSDFSNRLMVESNGNLVRWMHVTPWKQDIESCDRVGLMQAMPAGDAEKDVTGRRWEHRMELMRDAIIYNRNNPSIIFYESGNDGISEEHMAEMKSIRDLYDPYGGRAIGSREMLDSNIAEYGGEMLYINKSAQKPFWAMEYCRDEALRKYWDDYSFPYHKNGVGNKYFKSTVTNDIVQKSDATSYNRNQDSFFIETINRWYDYYRVRPGTGKRVNSGGTNIIFSDSNTHFRGAENYRRSGEVDAMRIPKDAFFAHQIMWNGWVDIEKHGTYICGHWQTPYELTEDEENSVIREKKDVLVASTGDRVELFVNGKSCGFGQQSSQFLFTFSNIKFEVGIVEAVSYDTEGNILSRTCKETVGTAKKINLKLIQAPDGFKADGADLVLVEVEVTDEQGKRCPLANEMITFNLSGEAEWRGGIAQGKEGNYILEKVLPVECGVNRILIRSTPKAGLVRLTAQSDGLEKAVLEFKSKQVSQKSGLSSYISGDNQPSYLERGATPETPSFQVNRKPVKIVNVAAGSNEKTAYQSYDDNELSKWSNTGEITDAWISYELEKDAIVREVELKLSGWRNKSYPIKICVDNIVVFEGETPKSLGYIVLPFKPTKGRYVRLQLIGQNKEDDAFGSIVEITGNKEIENNKTNTKAQFQIIEAEIYE